MLLLFILVVNGNELVCQPATVVRGLRNVQNLPTPGLPPRNIIRFLFSSF